MSRSPAQRRQRAMDYLAQGLLAPARAQLDALQAAAPQDPATQLLAADIAWNEDRVRESAAFALEAAQTAVDDADFACDVAAALLGVGEVVAAQRYLAACGDAGTLSVESLVRRADFELAFGDVPRALVWLDRAAVRMPGAATIHFLRGRLLVFLGRIDDADSAFRECLRLEPGHGEAALGLAQLRVQTADSHCLALLAAGQQRVAAGSREAAAFDFARYKVLEDLRFDAQAWRALQRGNATLDAHTREQARLHNAALRASCDYFAAHAVPPEHCASAVDAPQPIFIIGLPRSGTTLLERLLGNHPDVTAAGELFDFGRQLQWAADHRSLQDNVFFDRLAAIDLAQVGQRYLDQTRWRANGARWYTDKQTSNWMLAGLIHAALPSARILQVVREPMDACFSLYRAMFGDAYAIGNDFGTLAEHYDLYRRLMARWHTLAPGAILDVAYADLVRAPEATMRRVLAHCGLPWDARCVDLAASTEPVATLSAVQVRDAIHQRALGAWRRYAAQLCELEHALSHDADVQSSPT